MIDIVGGPKLQLTGIRFSTSAAAINEDLANSSDFRDVEVLRDNFTRRQHKVQRSVAIHGEYLSHLIQSHGSPHFALTMIQLKLAMSSFTFRSIRSLTSRN